MQDAMGDRMNELKADRILRQIGELHKELKEHQERCKHTKATFTYGSNTGNYDPTADCYWKNWDCPVCKKKWREYYE